MKLDYSVFVGAYVVLAAVAFAEEGFVHPLGNDLCSQGAPCTMFFADTPIEEFTFKGCSIEELNLLNPNVELEPGMIITAETLILTEEHGDYTIDEIGIPNDC